MRNEELWSKQSTSDNDLGQRVYYRCNRIKSKAKQQCNSGLYILYHHNSSSVTIYRSLNDHNHADLPEQSQTGITKTADIIKNYLDQGLRREEVMNQLYVDGLPVPTKTQLNNFVAKVRKETRGESGIKLTELKKLLHDNSNVPEDCNKAFIVDFKISDDTNNIQLNFFVSSKKLLNNAVGKELFAADTKYKVMWQDLPVSPIGTVDKDRNFHLIGMGVSTNEKEENFTFFFKSIKKRVLETLNALINPTIILCDAAEAISNAFLAVFGADCLVLTCWSHVKAAIKTSIGQYFPKEMQKVVLDDIEYLQLSRSTAIFENASLLFLKKYADYAAFVTYFNYEWLGQNRNWYEGAAEQTPSSNNALETFSRHYKLERTLRLRLPLGEFAEKLFDFIESWGIEYDSGEKPAFVDTLTLTQDIWTKGYQWSLIEEVVKRKTDDIISGGTHQISQWNECTKWETFDEFKRNSFGDSKIYLNESDWKQSKCTCPAFYKQYMCEHVVGIALRLKYVTVPVEAKLCEIGTKRKRGRPAKPKETLLRQ